MLSSKKDKYSKNNELDGLHPGKRWGFFMGCLKRIEIGLEFPGLHPLRTECEL